MQNSKVLSARPRLWYTALAQLYHSGKHHLVVDGARRALREFGVTIENLPITTDPTRITAAFRKLQLAEDDDLEEIAYLYHAAREAGQFLKTGLLEHRQTVAVVIDSRNQKDRCQIFTDERPR